MFLESAMSERGTSTGQSSLVEIYSFVLVFEIMFLTIKNNLWFSTFTKIDKLFISDVAFRKIYFRKTLNSVYQDLIDHSSLIQWRNGILLVTQLERYQDTIHNFSENKHVKENNQNILLKSKWPMIKLSADHNV